MIGTDNVLEFRRATGGFRIHPFRNMLILGQKTQLVELTSVKCV